MRPRGDVFGFDGFKVWSGMEFGEEWRWQSIVIYVTGLCIVTERETALLNRIT